MVQKLLWALGTSFAGDPVYWLAVLPLLLPQPEGGEHKFDIDQGAYMRTATVSTKKLSTVILKALDLIGYVQLSHSVNDNAKKIH